MTCAFHPEAEAEFNGAIDYYEIREAGLGYDFGVEVYSAIQRIVAYPRAWPVLEGEVRGRSQKVPSKQIPVWGSLRGGGRAGLHRRRDAPSP